MSNWYQNLNQIVILKGTGQPSLFPGLPFVAGSSVGLGPGNYVGNDKTRFAPRLGFIYSPLGTDRLIVRAGGGLYYQKIPWVFGSYELANNPPFTGQQSFEPAAGSQPTLNFGNAFPSGLGGIPSGVSVNAYPTHYKYPMTSEWNFTVESQLSPSMAVRATYLGAETEHLTVSFPINQPVPAPGPVQPKRPFQPFGPISFFDNIGTANTQQFQLSALRQLCWGAFVSSPVSVDKNA